MDGIAALPGLLVDFIATMFQTMLDVWATGLNLLLTTFVVWIGLIVLAITKLPGLLFDVITAMFDEMLSLWVAGQQALLDEATKLPGQAVSVISSIISTMKQVIVDAFNGMKDAAITGVSNVVSEIGKLPGQLLSIVSDTLSAGRSIGGAIISGIKAGISGAVGFAGDLAAAAGKAIKGAINDVIDAFNRAVVIDVHAGPFSFHLDPPNIPHVALGGNLRRLRCRHPDPDR